MENVVKVYKTKALKDSLRHSAEIETQFYLNENKVNVLTEEVIQTVKTIVEEGVNEYDNDSYYELAQNYEGSILHQILEMNISDEVNEQMEFALEVISDEELDYWDCEDSNSHSDFLDEFEDVEINYITEKRVEVIYGKVSDLKEQNSEMLKTLSVLQNQLEVHTAVMEVTGNRTNYVETMNNAKVLIHNMNVNKSKIEELMEQI